MIITVAELRQFVSTTETNSQLEFRIQAAESFICHFTNNDFVSRITHEKDYPPDVKLGVIRLLQWQFRNEGRNNGDAGKQVVSSETISRHSVTYAADSTESDIDVSTGYPRKLSAFLLPYMRARF